MNPHGGIARLRERREMKDAADELASLDWLFLRGSTVVGGRWATGLAPVVMEEIA